MAGHLDDQGVAVASSPRTSRRPGRRLRARRPGRRRAHPGARRRRAAPGGRDACTTTSSSTPRRRSPSTCWPRSTSATLSILHGDAGHPGAEEPAADARHARPARLPARTAGSSCSTAPTPRSGCAADDVEAAPQGTRSRCRSRQPRRAGLDQPRRRRSCSTSPGTPSAMALRGARRDHVAGRRRDPVTVPPAGGGARASATTVVCRGRSMSLADRLDSARRSHRRSHDARRAGPAAVGRRRGVDPFAEVKGRVHQALLEQPRAAAVRPAPAEQSELEQQVRQTLQAVIDVGGDAALARRPHPHRAGGLATRSSATARSSRCCATRRSPRSWSTARPDLRRARGQASTRSTPRFTDERTCAAPSTRSSAGSAAASTRRSPMVDARLPDGSRVNAVIPPIALDGSMLTIRKFAADPFTDRRPDRVRHADPGRCATSSRPASAAGSTS